MAVKNMKTIRGRISVEQYAQLEVIKKEHGFRSVYQIFTYLIDAFIKAAMPKPEEDPVHEEITKMFGDVTETDDSLVVRKMSRC